MILSLSLRIIVDLLFICVLKPITTDIRPCKSEIHACAWMDPEMYLNQPFLQRSPLFTRVNELIKNLLDENFENTKENKSSNKKPYLSSIELPQSKFGTSRETFYSIGFR